MSDELVHQLFQLFDEDNDGLLEKSALQVLLLDNLGNEELANQLMQCLEQVCKQDKEWNGMITLEEFTRGFAAFEALEVAGDQVCNEEIAQSLADYSNQSSPPVVLFVMVVCKVDFKN